jgi:hypothetical protein
MLESKWLDLLKASIWQLLGVAIGCFLFLFAANRGWLGIPKLASWMILSASFGGLICGCLAITSITGDFFNFFSVVKRFNNLLSRRKQIHNLRNYIPHMTPEERAIIAYLLAKNQMAFTGASDGGYATTLIGQGIIILAARGNQHIPRNYVPWIIPEHIWKELLKHKQKFPFNPRPGEENVEPWRIPWNLL